MLNPGKSLDEMIPLYPCPEKQWSKGLPVWVLELTNWVGTTLHDLTCHVTVGKLLTSLLKNLFSHLKLGKIVSTF